MKTVKPILLTISMALVPLSWTILSAAEDDLPHQEKRQEMPGNGKHSSKHKTAKQNSAMKQKHQNAHQSKSEIAHQEERQDMPGSGKRTKHKMGH